MLPMKYPPRRAISGSSTTTVLIAVSRAGPPSYIGDDAEFTKVISNSFLHFKNYFRFPRAHEKQMLSGRFFGKVV